MCIVFTCCSCGVGGSRYCDSRTAKIGYVVITLLSSAFAVVLRFSGTTMFEGWYAFDACEGDHCFGATAVYRVSFALCLFFLALAAFTACSPAAHVGAWFLKITGYVVLLAATFFIPNDVFIPYRTVAIIGSVVFVLIQLLIIIDFAFDIHEYLLQRMERYVQECESSGLEQPTVCQNGWAQLYIGSTVTCVLGSVIGLIVMWIVFPNCPVNNAFLAQTLIAGIVFMAVSMMERVGQGSLPPAIVWLHNVWLCWGALSNNPDSDCNAFAARDDLGSVILGLIVVIVSISWASLRAASSAYSVLHPGSQKTLSAHSSDDSLDGSESATAVSMPPPVMDRGKPAGAGSGDVEGAPDPEATRERYTAADETGSAAQDQVAQQRLATVETGVWMFHIVMALGGMYLAMLLTNWGSVRDETDGSVDSNPEASKTSMWIRITSQWVVYLMYGWILVGGLCCPDREFGTFRSNVESQPEQGMMETTDVMSGDRARHNSSGRPMY